MLLAPIISDNPTQLQAGAAKRIVTPQSTWRDGPATENAKVFTTIFLLGAY